MSITKNLLLSWYSSMKQKLRKILIFLTFMFLLAIYQTTQVKSSQLKLDSALRKIIETLVRDHPFKTSAYFHNF